MNALVSRDASRTLESADEVVRAIFSGLDRALVSVNAIDHALDRARAHVHAREVAQIHDNAREIAQTDVEVRIKVCLPDNNRKLDARFMYDPYVERALTDARINSPYTDRTRDRELTLTLTRARTGGLRRALDRAHALAGDLRRDLNRDRVLEQNRARELANDLDSSQRLADDLASMLHYAYHVDQSRRLAPVSDLDRGRTSTDGLGYARRLAIDLQHAISSITDRVSDLRRKLNGASAAVLQERESRRVTQSAVRLAAAAAVLLPARDRGRYSEEWQGELRELAAAGAGLRGQLGYAARLLLRTASLRSALAASRRRREAADD